MSPVEVEEDRDPIKHVGLYCARCDMVISRKEGRRYRFVMEWKYFRGELTANVKKVGDVKTGSVLTHVTCERPQLRGFQERMKKLLHMPKNSYHPLLF